ncbi:hypothetical protein DHD80_13355 [Gramella sp. AN32]|nr:hypothetical protein [Gramella sp. AN32]
MMKSVNSFLVVELMRNGKSPQEACEIAIGRIIKNISNYKDFQVGLPARNKAGEVGFYGIHSGFSYAQYKSGVSSNNSSTSFA